MHRLRSRHVQRSTCGRPSARAAFMEGALNFPVIDRRIPPDAHAMAPRHRDAAAR
ncbi:MAG: hypothetical protein ACODAQ_06110 [Phycisphaeraceae bacterium]